MKDRFFTMWGAVLAISLLGCSGAALDKQEGAGAPPQDWRAAAREHGLTDEDIARLERDGILVTNETYKQVFSAYLSGDLPLFITSDSLLNAYHVLYEESIRQLETYRAKQMPEMLRLLTGNLQAMEIEYEGDPALPRAARKRALLVLGVALRLLYGEFALQDPELNALLEEEVRRVRVAEGMFKPEWLGPPDAGFIDIDYSRYKPRGFYTSSALLQNYFQSVAWLQSIPFRLNNDEEFFSLILLKESTEYRPPVGDSVKAATSDEEARRLMDQERVNEVEAMRRQLAFFKFFSSYESFVGPRDDWDLMAANGVIAGFGAYSKELLDEMRKEILEDPALKDMRPRINDLIALPPGEAHTAQEPSFRVLSAHRTPSAVLFHQTTNTSEFFVTRDFPEGLEVCAALGSEFARQNLSYRDKDALLAAIDAAKPEFEGHTLYHNYLNALAALLDAPPEQAPPFMSGRAWQAKSCNTVLGGWAQLRHTWVLQAKQTVKYAGLSSVPAGFVEPDTDFYCLMGDLADASLRLLESSGVFSSVYDDLIHRLRDASKVLENVTTEEEAETALRELRHNHLSVAGMLFQFSDSDYEDSPQEQVAKDLSAIQQLIRALEANGQGLNQQQLSMIAEYTHELKPLWEELGRMCRRLEIISLKQLHRVPLNKSEDRFVQSYGEQLARIMFYEGNSYLSPDDDAPRVVDVYSNPNFLPITYLEAGIARPRKMYVLYPWEGQELLCVGAVLPYYEFTSTERLTDAQWLEMLDSDGRPPVPEWARAIYRSGGLGIPEMLDR